MLRTIIRKDFRSLRVVVFGLLAAFLAILGLDNLPTTPGLFLMSCGSLPILAAILIANQVVASEKEKQHLAALMSLPIVPQRLWLIKFFSGLALTLLFALFAYIAYACYCEAYSLTPFAPDRYDILGVERVSPAEPMVQQLLAGIEWTEAQVIGVVLYLAVAAYAISFVAATFSPNAIVASLSGFLLLGLTQVLFVMVMMAAFFLNLPFCAVSSSAFDSLFVGGCCVVVLCGLISALALSFAAFKHHHRRQAVRLRAYALAVTPAFLPVAVALAYLLLLSVVNLPVLNPPSPGFDADFLRNPDNLASAQEFQRLTAKFKTDFGTSYDRDFQANLTTDWDTIPTPAMSAILDSTAALRNEFFDYAAAHPLTPYCQSPYALYNTDSGYAPDGGTLISLWKLESFDIRREARRGNLGQAQQQALRLMAATDHCLDSSTLFLQLVGIANTGIAAEAACAIVPLDGSADPRFIAALDREFATLENKARHAFVSAFIVESAYFDGATSVLTNLGIGYPFGNKRIFAEYHTELVRQLIAASTRPYYTVAGRLPQLTYSRTEYLLYPAAVTLIEVATPKLNSVLNNSASVIDMLRLARLHLLLARYRRETGRRAMTPDTVYRHYNLTPFLDDFTGQPFPDAVITADGRIDFEYPQTTAKRIQQRAWNRESR